MLSVNKTISINGTSSVEVNGVKTPIAYLNSQVGEKHNLNYSVQDEKLFKENISTFKADRDEFEAYVEKFTENLAN